MNVHSGQDGRAATAATKESKAWDELCASSPEEFVQYLVQVSAGVNAGAVTPQEVGGKDGFELPEIRLGEDTSIFTRLTDPHNPRWVAAVLEAVTIGPDLTEEQWKRVHAFIAEFADCYALSMKEVKPIPNAEHSMNIPADATFNTKIHQRPMTPAQKQWYNAVINEMLAAGIIECMDPKDVKYVSPTTLAQKAH
ncbi:hypothetical protein K438DRAFT_1630409, partial [Mycena galopus ATCC 62051]